MVRRMMMTALEGIPSVKSGDDMAVLVVEACKRSDLVLEDGDVVVLAQKIVSKTEGRWVDLRDIVPLTESSGTGRGGAERPARR